jgi:hypothetical protein
MENGRGGVAACASFMSRAARSAASGGRWRMLRWHCFIGRPLTAQQGLRPLVRVPLGNRSSRLRALRHRATDPAIRKRPPGVMSEADWRHWPPS